MSVNKPAISGSHVRTPGPHDRVTGFLYNWINGIVFTDVCLHHQLLQLHTQTHTHKQSDSDIQTREPTYAAHTPAMCQHDCVIFTGSKNLQKFLYNRHAKTKTDAPETLWHLWVPERYNQSGFVALVKYECSPPKVDAKGDDYGTLGHTSLY